MSGFGGFGGFGQNNNNQQQQSTGFGGFGSTNTANTGFGSTANNTGFGATNNTTGGLFGGGSSGFGNSGGFGTQAASSPFGAAKPAFGTPASTAGGGLFGSNTATTGSGFGFGSTTNNNTTSAFGSTGTTGGGLFGSAAKPAFGASTTTPAFGGTGSFGSPSTTFGATPAIGVAAGECQGTGAVQFSATLEKEPNSSTNQQNSFQNICFQQPYQKFSQEELRLADYAQGRRHGQGTAGATGAFGQGTGFGGFSGTTTTNNAFGGTNNATGGLFGNNQAGGFGQTQPSTSAFGANGTSGGGLFGAKPATGGLFGTTQTQTQPSTGLFGSTPSTGFGTPTATNTGFGAPASGTSLFGANNNQAKPSGFSFGNAQPAAANTGFGTNSTTTGGFGSTGGSLFGNNAGASQPQQNANPFGSAQPAASGSLFGGFGTPNNQQQQQTGTNSLFGSNNQAKPATGGLFGTTNATTNTGGSLFGSNPQQNNTNPFGGAQNNTSGGLFGQKPATNTGGLFGNAASTNTGGGLFGNNANNQNQQQPNTGTSLFGGLNNQQKPSLFGGQSQQNTGGLFGGNNNQQNTGSLFGGLNNTQTQPSQAAQSGFGGSLFGGSQQNQSQPQSLTASINDPTAFGTSMFANLATPDIQNPGPIATPLSSLSKQKKPGILPIYKLNPSSSLRGSSLTTPQRRGGFGFSYSTYGSPGSASSTSSTPLNLGSSLLGGRGLSKSMSTSSLRTNSYTNSLSREDSLLAPGAFSVSPSNRFNSTGSMKKLVINRSIRSDLFSPPSKESNAAPMTSNQNGILKKRVSFDTSAIGGVNGVSSPLKQVQNTATPTAEEMGFLRSSSRNGNLSSQPNGEFTQPEMEQVKGNELAIVPEEDPASTEGSNQSSRKPVSVEDPAPGRYWMEPSKEEIQRMSRTERSQVHGFTVGRDGIGQIRFKVPVDLNAVNIDDIFDKIVVLQIRSATVYPEDVKAPVPKPPMGKGLNVPAVIELHNSWPRKDRNRRVNLEKSGPRFKKHLDRLAGVKDTTFLGYDKDTGVWTFSVEHFTTYGLEDDDDEMDGEGASQFEQSTLSISADSPTPTSATPRAYQSDQSFVSTSEVIESEPEDTFDFKKKRVVLPGAFDNQEAFVDDAEMDDQSEDQDQESFLDDRSTGSRSNDGIDEPMDQDVFEGQELVRVEDQDMAGSYPHAGSTVEPDEHSQDGDDKENSVMMSGPLMRARLRAMRASGSPLKKKLQLPYDDWAELLQRSVSPRKQDREELKRMANSIENGDLGGNEEEVTLTPRNRAVSDGHGFATSIDLMNSLFGETKSPVKANKAAKGFEWPYQKVSRTDDFDETAMDPRERAFHNSHKPTWGPDGTLVYAAPPNSCGLTKRSMSTREKDGLLVVQKGGVVSEARDIRFAKFSNESSAEALQKQKALTTFELDGGIPRATITKHFKLGDFYDDANARDAAGVHEKHVWELAGILFDGIHVPAELSRVPDASNRLRKDSLSTFWRKLVETASSRDVVMAKSSEEKAIASLSGHNISDACSHLLNGKNFHLATLIALIGDSDTTRKDIREQLNEWQKSRVLSEISQPIRALYELLAGNVSVCAGVKAAPIEDRIESFIISQRFGFDWRQAFGLRLWYGILASEPLDKAVQQFSEDLEQEKEVSTPRAWYIEQGILPLWDDKSLESRKDLLWGLLKLYADRGTDLETVLRPENSQLSPLDFRLSWQLSRALTAFDKCSYGSDGEKADQLTLSFASQLTSEGNWLDATFVLLHLSSAAARAKSIQDHLSHHADRIGTEDSKTFTTLVQEYKIPVEWLWEAKALYMRSVQEDPQGEVQCLLSAGSYSEAHRTFSKEVAPRTVVERDWQTLRTLLLRFKGKERNIPEWYLGGELYADYLCLLDMQKSGRHGKDDSQVLERILSSLPAMVAAGKSPSFMEVVAIKEISGVVAKLVIEMGRQGLNNYLPKVLRLPLTEDNYLKHTVDLSMEYYKAVMAAR